MENLREAATVAYKYLLSHLKTPIETAIILGTGLGSLVNEITIENEIEYKNIPFFPVATVVSHEGKLINGKIDGKNIAVMSGRMHYYEGYTLEQITFPIRVLKLLGVKNLIISNASGNLNPKFSKGEIMLIKDHINLMGVNPLIGVNDDFWGPRFPDMSEPYSIELIEKAKKVATDNNIKLNEGVYAGMTGPSLETKAEYKMLQILGVDAVGMSTVPENIVAVQMQMKVLGLSILSDDCFPETLKPVSVEEIIATASSAEPSLTKLVKEVVKII